MSIRSWFFAVVMLLAAVPPLPAAEDPLAGAAMALQRAVDSGKADSILQVQPLFRSMAAARPGEVLPHYWIAVSEWRVVPLLNGRDRDLAKKHCEAGLAEAEAALKLAPDSAEALAIRASLQGLSLAYKNPAAVMTLGPEMAETMQRALQLAPENPRVRLIEGIQTMHRPSFVGGGADKAMPSFERAIALFEEAPRGDGLEWGREDAFIWAGQAAMRLERYEAARDYYRRALEVRPQQAWVTRVLLPAAEKAIAGARP